MTSLRFCGILLRIRSSSSDFFFSKLSQETSRISSGRLLLIPLTSSTVSGRALMIRAISDFFSRSPKTGQSRRRRPKLRVSLMSMIPTRSVNKVLSSPSKDWSREVLRGPSDKWSFSSRLRTEAPTSALNTSRAAPLRSRQTQINASGPRARRAIAERRWVTRAGIASRSNKIRAISVTPRAPTRSKT